MTRIVFFEAPVIWQHFVEAPAIITNLNPVIQVLSQSHAERSDVDGAAVSEDFALNPSVDLAIRFFLVGLSVLR
jgi:hypothetical protein